jgi:hypothetical protein
MRSQTRRCPAGDPGGDVQCSGGEQPGDLGQSGTVTVTAVSVDRIRPHRLRDSGDRGVFAAGHRPPDGELAAERPVLLGADVGEERFRAAGGVGADQHRPAMSVGVGNLRLRGIENRDVVGGGVDTGVAAAESGGEELAGVVAEVLSQNASIG